MPSSDPSLKSRIRAPIIWIIVPLIAGYLIGRETPEISSVFLIGGGIGLGAIWTFHWCKNVHHFWLWKVVGVMSVFLLSWGYMLLNLPSTLDWEGKPDREANLTIKIMHTFSLNDQHNRQAGYAEIVDAPAHLGILVGQRIYYFLAMHGNENGPLVRSQTMEVRGLLSSISFNSDNSFERYLFSQGITFKLYRGQVLGMKKPSAVFYRFCEIQNRRLEAILRKGRNAKNEYVANIYTAMLLGNKASLTPEQKYAFQTTGSLHLFAISGLHVGVIAGCIAFLLKLIRVKNPWAAIIGLIILFLYVEITGGAPSAMRAFLMVTFYWGGRALKRKKSAFSALLASALVALILNPFNLWNIGFQLSYAVVGSILLYGLPLNEVVNNLIDTLFGNMKSFFKSGLRWLGSLMGISIAANIGSTFLAILYFKVFAPGAVLLSIVVIPLASVVIVIGFISLLVGLIGLPFLSGQINLISWFIIRIMEVTISASLKIPGLFWESFIAKPLISYIALGATFGFLYWGHRFNQLQRSLFYSIPTATIILFVLFLRIM